MDGDWNIPDIIVLRSLQMHLFDVQWRTQDSENYEPGLVGWAKNSDEPRFVRLCPGKAIGWTIRGPRRCIGSVQSTGRRSKCPEKAIVEHGKRRCGPCRAMDVMDPCIRCDGRECNATEDRVKRCSETNYAVYLAIFNDRTLKVGVSSQRRLVTRWVEQGADFGIMIAEVTDGRKARQLEYALSRSPRVTRQVRTERKTSLLLKQLRAEEAQSIAQGFLDSVDRHEISHEMTLVDLSRFYGMNELTAEPHLWRSRGTQLDGLQLLGTVVSMKGPLLVTRIEKSFSVANLNDLIGYTIDEDADISVISQTGILDFT